MISQLILFVDHSWESVEHQKEKMVDELLELLDTEISLLLVVVQIKDLLGFVSGVIPAKEDDRGEELSRRYVLVELRGLCLERRLRRLGHE